MQVSCCPPGGRRTCRRHLQGVLTASVTGCHWRVAHWQSGLLPFTAVASLHLIGWVLVTVISAISARIRRQKNMFAKICWVFLFCS